MAYYSDELIDDVISSTDIVSVINEYVPLTKRGVNYIGLCPFHKEKTPSFTVSADRQIYKCFGCGEGGNVFSFVSKVENLDFKETLELLAERANIDVTKYIKNAQGVVVAKDEKEEIFNISKDAARYFHEALLEAIESKNNVLIAYLNKRKLDMNTIKRFGIGFGNKKSIGLVSYLKSLGYSEENILKAGVVAKTSRGTIYENFAGRLIFPILDIRDRVIAFGGRVLDNSLPKYVNSPENIIYTKGKNLFALNISKREELTNVILTEGYMDTVALQKSGVKNAVASLGTALTEGQAKLLKKYTSKVIIAYDQDNAGKTATLRAIGILEAEGLKAYVLKLNHDDVKDPDEYINKYGVDSFNECVKNAATAVEYKIAKEIEDKDLNKFEDKVEFLTKVAAILSKIENSIEQNMYIDSVSLKYNIGKDVLVEQINKILSKENIAQHKQAVVEQNIILKKKNGTVLNNVRKRQEEYILALLIGTDKKYSKEIMQKFSVGDFCTAEYGILFLKFSTLIEQDKLPKDNILSSLDNAEDIKIVSGILCSDLDLKNKDKLILELEKDFKFYGYKSQREEILAKLSDKNITEDESRILGRELSFVLKKMAKLK